MTANPQPPSPRDRPAIVMLSLPPSRSTSTAVPGVSTLITSLLTTPLAFFGSSSCSETATLNPRLSSFAI